MSAILKALPTTRKGPKPRYRAGSEVLSLFPRGLADDRKNVIYAIAFKGDVVDVVKVGRSMNPRDRLTNHWRTAKGEVLWLHMFEPMDKFVAMSVEREVPAVFDRHASRIEGSEWYFSGASKAQVIALLRPLIARCKAEYEEFWSRHKAAEAAGCPRCRGFALGAPLTHAERSNA